MCSAKKDRCAAYGRLNGFASDVAGSVTAFTAVIFLMLVVGAGMAVDFMRHEAHRVELQDALDRGVLAAAALDQVQPAEDTIRGFLRTTSFIEEGYELQVEEGGNEYSRQITAAVQLDLRTYFLKIVGRPTMKVSAHGSAFESKQDVEISLVLDVSTSMSGCKLGQVPCEIGDMDFTGFPERSRLDQMKDDASNFVDLMVNERTNKYLTMSVVPFAGQVNPGPTGFSYLSRRTIHPYSYCLEFRNVDFGRATLPGANTRRQMQYFSYSYYYLDANLDSTIEYGWCPVGNTENVVYHSDDPDALKGHINGLKTHEGTGSQYGMKWGVALLDPSSQSLTSQLVTSGDVKNAYQSRPGAYDTDKRLKVVVFMSDGNTTNQVRVEDYAYSSASDRDWWATNVPTWETAYTYDDMNMEWTPVQTAREQFIASCDAAKAQGITIFTIGFDIEADSDAYTDLSSCATTMGHFYDVDGEELREAFSAIAATIQKLKLIN